MKCIQCGTENNLKDRTANQGRCKSCNHPFAFEPTAMKDVKLTDPLFAKAIADISLNGTLFFTPKQFLYFLDRRFKRQSSNPVVWGFLYIFFSIWTIGFIGGFSSFILGDYAFPLVSIVFNAGVIYYLFNLSNSPKSNYKTRKDSTIALQIVGALVIIIGLAWTIFTKLSLGYFISPAIGLFTIYLGISQKQNIGNIANTFLIDANKMQDWLNAWNRKNGAIERLLPVPETALAPSIDLNIQNSDVTDYSFDRLIVCNSAEIAQMLIANNFHFENNCAILSSTGYPANVFDTVLQMLRRNPELMVYAFHDASPNGISLIHQLRTDATWFQESTVTIIDLGLLPRQVLANSRNLFIHQNSESASTATQLPPAIRQTLTAPELAWLDAGNYVELESFTPQQLIQILNRGIVNSRELDTSDAGGTIWIGDNYNSVYAVESFG
jgi:hypothetical protein